MTIIGGGDTDVAVSKRLARSRTSATCPPAGGAFLALLTGEVLPAVDALGGYTGLGKQQPHPLRPLNLERRSWPADCS